MIPQINLILFGGYKLPPVVSIPRTNVAESADVIKNMLISRIAMLDINVVNGKCSNTENNAASSPVCSICWMMFAPSKNSKLIAEPPNTVNQNAPKIDGTNNTPTTNSLIVLPLETRAINVPTNGAHAIHHAQ